jgi:hypothetical protein
MDWLMRNFAIVTPPSSYQFSCNSVNPRRLREEVFAEEGDAHACLTACCDK